MKVRAKFKCWRVEHNNSADPKDRTARVQFQAAYDDGNTDNANWSKYTPSANCEMFITNPDAIDQFEEGKYYFVDFKPAD